MNCDDCLEKISEYVDGQLTAWEENNIKNHLHVCPECRQIYLELTELSTDIMESIQEIPVRGDLGMAVLAAVKADRIAKLRTLTGLTIAVLILLGSPILFLFSHRIVVLTRLAYSLGLTFLSLAQGALSKMPPLTVFLSIGVLSLFLSLGLYVMRGLLREPESGEVAL